MSEAQNLYEEITITETHVFSAILFDGCEVDLKKGECSLNVAFIGNGKRKPKRVIICGDLYQSWTDDDEILFRIIKENATKIINEPTYLVKLGVAEEPVAEESVAEEAV